MSYKFNYVETNLSNILQLILGNQNILRYIYYLDSNPLDPSKPNIDVNKVNPVNSTIYLLPHDPTVISQDAVKLFINPHVGNLKNTPNQGQAIETYLIDIVVPNAMWLLSGQAKIRPFRIANEISLMIDGQPIAGTRKTYIDKYQVISLDDRISALILWVTIYTPNF